MYICTYIYRHDTDTYTYIYIYDTEYPDLKEHFAFLDIAETTPPDMIRRHSGGTTCLTLLV